MPDAQFDSHAGPAPADCQAAEPAPLGSALLFGDEKAPPLWLWLAIERDDFLEVVTGHPRTWRRADESINAFDQ